MAASRCIPAGLVCAIVFVLGAVPAAADAVPAASPDSGDSLAEILDRFDRVQGDVKTLRAGLTMTTHDPMFKEPVVYRGRFFMTKPKSVRWDFTTPEEMRFVIADDQYTGYYPKQKRAERKNIQRWSEQLFRYFGLGRQSTDLERFYTISLAEPDSERPGTHVLNLEPRKRRARKRVDTVRFWVSKSSWLPERVEYTGKDGSRRIVEFERIELNVDLAASLYRVDLPADVEVSAGFHPFGGGN